MSDNQFLIRCLKLEAWTKQVGMSTDGGSKFVVYEWSYSNLLVFGYNYAAVAHLFHKVYCVGNFQPKLTTK